MSLRNHRTRVTGNFFLDSLPLEVGERFAPALVLVTLKRGQVLGRPNERTNFLYFPLKSVISTITQMADGLAVEVGLAGHEGIGGLSYAFGSRTSLHTTIVQIADSALRLDADTFEDAVNTERELRERVLAYAHYVFTAAAQFAACNRLHPVEERYARWLLMAEDRVQGPELTLTQEFMAQMLGVRRAGVTVVAGKMSEAGTHFLPPRTRDDTAARGLGAGRVRMLRCRQ